MRLRKNAAFIVSLSLLTIALMTQAAPAEYITYTQDFATNVDPFPGTTYTDWTAVTTLPAYVKFKVAGTALHEGNTVSQSTTTAFSTAYVTAPGAFGLADFGADVTVSSDFTTVQSNIGNQNLGLRLGNLTVQYLPAYVKSSGHGLARYYQVATDDTTMTYLNPPAEVLISFVPSVSILHLTMAAVKNGSNWDVSVTMTQGTNTWTDEVRTFSDAIVTGGTGVISKAGYVFQGSRNQTVDNTLDNFQVTMWQVPEPSAVVMLISGMVGLLCYAWRKRR